MSNRTLFLAWRDAGNSKKWFPVGRLDADVERSTYRFRYISGAKRAKEEVGFPELIEFPSLQGDYRSSELFPLFKNRVMNPARPDFKEYLPRYLVYDLSKTMANEPGDYRVEVVRTTMRYTSTKPSVLIEMSAPWPSHELMSRPDFRPLVGSTEMGEDDEATVG